MRLNKYKIKFRVIGNQCVMFRGVDINKGTKCPDVGREITVQWLDKNKEIAALRALRMYEGREKRNLEVVEVRYIAR